MCSLGTGEEEGERGKKHGDIEKHVGSKINGLVKKNTQYIYMTYMHK